MALTLPGIAWAWATGIALADQGGLPVWAALLVGAGCLGAALASLHLRVWTILLAAAASGALALHQSAPPASLSFQSQQGIVEGHVRRAGRTDSLAWLELIGAVGAGDLEVPRELRLVEGFDVRAQAPGLEELDARPGQRVRARVTVRAPQPTRNPGVRDRERAFRRSGQGTRAWLVDPELRVRQGRLGVRGVVERFRARRLAALSGGGEGRGLLRALGLGDRGTLSPETRRRFRSLGISHLLAVSGLHLAILAGLSFWLLAGLLRRSAWLSARMDTRRCALLSCLGSTGAYALLTGGGVPVQRAWVFFSVAVLASLILRTVGASSRLAAAALVVLVLEPAALFDPGAQLSFAAAAALLSSSHRSSPGGFQDLLRASATATAVTAPIAAWHFGSSAPTALLVNLLAVPWSGIVALPAALAAVALSTLPSGVFVSVGLGVCDALAGASLDAVAKLAELLPTPSAAPRAPTAILVVAAVALAVTRAKATRWRVLGAMVVSLGLVVAPPQRFDPEPPRLVALDVGQGDALLVQGVEGTLLVDAGAALPGRWDRGERDVLPALAALGVQRLALVIASHGDLDHRGGLPAVLEGIDVGRLWLPLGQRNSPDFEELIAVAHRRGIRVEARGAGSPALQLGDLRVQPLWPPSGFRPKRRNDASLVVRVEQGAHRVLLAGDIEARAEAALLASGTPLRAEILVVPHHGSRTSSTRAFLDRVAPRVAVISAPCVGRFPTPHVEVLKRLRDRGIQTWWTGRDGAVRISLAEPGVVRGQGSPRRGCGSR